jgi:outer membrane protein OmpA-like peptidoglycan-associated protein
MEKRVIRPSDKLALSSHHLILFIISIGLFVITSSSFSQDEIKARLFQNVNELLSKAKAEQADLLSPTSYAKAIELYDEASKDYDRGKNIQKKISELKTFLESALQNSKMAKYTFEVVLQAQEDALEANAIEFSRELYEKAEGLFFDATRTLENGSLPKAKEKSGAAEKLYRESELVAIKASIIGNVKEHIQKAQDKDVNKYAPITFKTALALLNDAEKILTSNRSAKTEARKKAEAAAYEIKHATYLASIIQKIKKDDSNWEKMILQNEKYLIQLINQLGFTPEFDQGFETPVQAGVDAIKSLRQEKQQLSTEISSQDQRIESLEATINNLKLALDKSKELEAGLKAKLNLEQQKRDKFNKIESIFSRNEAKVLREGEEIRIRLIGLNFVSGKAVINPEYFQLLTKLQRVIRLFDNHQITIEGHTDNIGDDRLNQSLSLQRAKAIKSYLMANMALSDDQIVAVGYGELKPIASNDSEDGRAQNRRIDVVLSPTE